MAKISGLYLQGRRGEEEGQGSGKGKSIYHPEFIVLISEMITQLAVCSTE